MMSGSSLLLITVCALYWWVPSTLADIMGWGSAILLFLALVSYLMGFYRQKLTPIEPRPQIYAVVTGASSGIGKEIVIDLAARGYNLVLVARNEKVLYQHSEELQTKWGVHVQVISMDLSQPGAARKLHSALSELGVGGKTGSSPKNNVIVDVLVNCAGFGLRGDVLDADVDSLSSMIQVNAMASVELSRLIGADMRARGRGRILNVSSIVGSGPGPNQAVYSATKALLTSFTVALQYELQPFGVGVTCLCPGATWSGFGAVAECPDALVFTVPLPGLQMTSKAVGRFGVKAMMKGSVIATPGLLNNVLINASAWVPRQFILWFTTVMWGTGEEFIAKRGKFS